MSTDYGIEIIEVGQDVQKGKLVQAFSGEDSPLPIMFTTPIDLSPRDIALVNPRTGRLLSIIRDGKMVWRYDESLIESGWTNIEVKVGAMDIEKLEELTGIDFSPWKKNT